MATRLWPVLHPPSLPTTPPAPAARPQVEALATSVGCEVSVLTAVSRDEMAVVLSATAPGVDREEGLAYRIPMVPPIGDTYVFDQDDETRERWLAKLRHADDDVRQVHRDRLDFVRRHGYLVSFLPMSGAG